MCLLVACSTLSGLLFLLSIRYKVLGNKITWAEWELNIVTVPDYSVELKISKAGYQVWYDTIFHKEGGDYSKNISPGLSLKCHIIDKIEAELTRELRLKQE